ncbi:MAG: UDP-3-O-(3-hydroxymyristoyl)glucosamine N-acyltransferase [Cocleimonas sp.]
MKQITLEKLAELTGSTFSGNKDVEISSVASIEKAGQGQVSFISNPKYKKLLKDSQASVVILDADLASEYKGNSLINNEPYLTFAKVLEVFYKDDDSRPAEIHPRAVIGNNVSIAEDAQIGPNVVISKGTIIAAGVKIGAGCFIGEDCSVGERTTLNPNVTLYKETRIGRDSIIHSGAVIGADGFGFALKKDKSWLKILQIGRVEIGNTVEVGANTTIDRAALGVTMICDDVKLDNQIQIGHNVHIDKHTVIAGGTMVGGSTSIGKRCQIGGAVAIAGHISIADDVVITGKTSVIKSISKLGVYSSGTIADENRKWRRNSARFRKLDEMAKTINKLKKHLDG